MAVSQVVRSVTVNAVGGTLGGSLTITAPVSATALTASIQVRAQPSEFELLGVTTGATNAASTVAYNCRGVSGVNYPVTFNVVDIATA